MNESSSRCMRKPQSEEVAKWQAEYRARRQARDERVAIAQARGVEALKRLLDLAATRDTGQIFRIALFIGACCDGHRHFDFYDFRSLDEEIGSDMMDVLNAHRYGLTDVQNMFPGAREQIIRVLKAWGIYDAGQTRQGLVMPFTS